MIHKVIVHHPTRGTLAEHTYQDRAEAEDARDRLQMEHHRSPGVSVVLLGAETEEAMRYTHGRYWPLVALLALLQGCGPAWPTGWGDPCDPHEACPLGACAVSRTRSLRCMETREPGCAHTSCEPGCETSADCDPGWRCFDSYVCRLPCGVGLPACPPGSVCDGLGCEPS